MSERDSDERHDKMAQQKNQDIMSRLADRGEQVVGRITDLPGAKGLLDRTAKTLDDVQKRLRSIVPLEKRVAAIEKRLDKLEGTGKARKRPAAKRTTSAGASTAKRAATPKRPSSSS